jgi:hypothetical protein
MQRYQFNDNTTLDERLVDLARKVRADVETLPPSRKRDNLIQQLRTIETADELTPFW